MRWAFMYHPSQVVGSYAMMPPKCVPEYGIAIAQSQGWVLLVSETDVLETLQPTPFNPPRSSEDQ